MKHCFWTQTKFLIAFVITVFFSSGVYGQKPANNSFDSVGVDNPISSPTKMASVVESGLPFTFSHVSPLGTTGSVLYFGESQGLFRPGDKACFFNYTTGAVIPGASVGATGTGDYRLHFTQATPSDTGINKLGNFGLQSMYIAIGTGKAADVKIYGFRAGRVIAQKTITGLSSNNDPLTFTNPSGEDLTDLGYAGSDAYSGTNVTFGTNWQFLDGIRFEINDKSIPLSIDEIRFVVPSTVAPSIQASATNFTNITGITSRINWTKGTGDRSAVFMSAVSSGAPDIDQPTTYTANTIFGSGTTTTGGWTCVYNSMDNLFAGSTNSVNVTNLTPGTTYRVMVVSYNGTGTFSTYNVNENLGGLINAANFTTVAVPATQASNISVTPDYTDFGKATISWTNGSGAKRAVFVRNNTSTTDAAVAPLHNNNNADAQHFTYTAFTDSSLIPASSPARVGSSGWYCVYNSTGTSVSMTKITNAPGQTLRVMVVEYNGTAGAETYNTTSASNVVDYFNANYPLPVTDPATGITSSGATLNGSIDPRSGNITNGTYVYSLSSSLSSIQGTITTLTPAATSILGSASATAVAGSLTGLLPSTTYYYRLSATSNAGLLTATNSTGGATNGIRSFTTAPVVSSVSATTANGSYKAGQVIVVTVAFTAAVSVTGTPTIALNSGGTASYASGSGSATLSFNYTISGGETSADLDYTSTSALALSGGTIKDASADDALLTLPTVGGASSLGGQKNIVIDTQVPTLGAVTIASNNSTSSLAKIGNAITLSFTASETITTPTVTIAGGAATVVNVSGNAWTATYTMTGSEASGTVAFNISFSDIAVNNGTDVTATTNSSTVTYDKTVPTLTTVTIASNNATTSLAKTGDIVTASFTSSETIAVPTVTMAGHTAAITNVSGNNWIAAYTTVSGDASGIVAFSISFSDLAGNAGTTVTATTNSSSVTFDKTAPSLTTVVIVSDNSNTAYAKVGSLVTVSFTSSEAVLTPTATVTGNTATITNVSGNNWTATYTLLSGDATGVIPFNISFSDLSGNAGTVVNATTNSSSVTFDKTAPLLNTVTIVSNNANTALAKTGDIITINFTSNETITAPTVAIAGQAATVTNTGGNSWKAVYTMASSDASGIVSFNILFSDLAANAGTAVTATTNSSSVTFDKTVPLLTAVTIASNNANTALAKTGDVITINLSSNESIFTPTVTIAGNTATVSNSSGNNWTAVYTMASSDASGIVPFNISFSDLAGNAGIAVTATTNSSSVTFDKTLPSLSAVSILSDNANTAFAKIGNTVTLSFTSDESIAVPTVTIAGHSVTATNGTGNNWTAAYAMVSGDASGNVSFNIFFSDLTGNAGTSVTATTNSSAVTFDKTAPSLTTISISSNNANPLYAKTGDIVTLAFTAGETIVTPAVTIGGQTATVTNTGTNNWSAVYTMAGGDVAGPVSFNIAFSDLAGNAGTAVTATTNSSSVTFDKTVPLLTTVAIASNNANTALAKTGDLVTISLTSNESILTPTITVAGHTAAVTNTGGNNWAAAYTMASSDASGIVSFNISFSDLAGNAGTAVTATTNSGSVTFDKSAPLLTTVTIASNNANTALAKTGELVTINFISNESILTPTVTVVGHTVAVTNTGSNNWVAAYTMVAGDASGIISFNIAFIDLTGNAGTAVTATTNSSSVTFDKTVPLLTVVTIASNNANTALAKVADLVTINLTSNESILTPTVTIGGHTATITNTSSNNWTAAYAMVSGDASGIIPFSIAFSDLSGNPGIAVTATTNSSSVTFDKTAPSLTAVSIQSDNANTALAKAGNKVTISFTSSETIATPTTTIAGATASVTNTGGNNWNAVYTMASTDAAGTVPFAISFSDLAVNSGTTVTATTNSSSVVFDNTAPSLTSVSVASNNANTALIKTGETITLSFTSNKTIQAPTVTIAGHSVTATNGSGNNWTAAYTMISTDASGIVSFNISFSDLSGNAGVAVTATTNSSTVTFDKTAPLLTAVTIASNNANTALAKTGDILTINLTSNETIFTPTITVAGHIATATNTGGNNWTAAYTMVNGDAAGTVSFNISFSDLAGNAGTTVTTTTNSSSVIFDKTSPSLTAVSVVSNNANTALAKTGDKITVSFTADETIATPTVTIAGATATINNTSGNNWTAVYTMTNSEPSGIVSFTISFSDQASNAGTAVTATTNSSSMLFDKTAPLLTAVSIVSDNANTAVAKPGNKITVSFTSNETITAPSVTIMGSVATVTNTGGNNWTAVYTMTVGDAAGTIPFAISFADLAGNSGTVTATTNSTNVLYDKTTPSLVSVSVVSNNANSALIKTGEAITLSFTSSKTIATPTVTIAGHTVTATNGAGNNWTAVYTMVSGDVSGIVSFNISFSDLSGNAGTVVTTTTNSSSVTFDKTAPLLTTVTIASNNGNAALAKAGDVVSINLTASESINSPVVTVAGHTAGVTNTNGNNWLAVYTMVNGDATGTVSFNISFSDLAGNAGVAVTATSNSSSVIFDKTAPLLNSVTIASDNANPALAKPGNKVTLSFISNETITTPTVTIAGAVATVANISGNNWTVAYTMSGADASGTVSFNISFSDLAGNPGTATTSTTNASSVVFDKTAPSLSVVSTISNNANTGLIKTGETITLNFIADKVIATPSVTIAGHTVTATNGSGNGWTAAYTMVSADASGIVSFSISFSDLTGIAGATVTNTTDGSSVSFDKTVPSLTTVSILSDNANTALAKNGNLITVNFTSDEPILAPTATIAGHAATLSIVNSNSWKAVYTMINTDTAGSIPFSISFNDLSGNAGATVTATTNNSSVVFDKTIPSLTTVSILSDNTNTVLAKVGNSITVNFTSNEPVLTPTATIAGHSAAVSNVGGNNWKAVYTMVSTDAAGIIPFSIGFNDLSGNAGATVNTTTNNSSVTYDKTGASLTAVAIISNNTDPLLAKPGDIVTLSFTSAETIAVPLVTISGHIVAATNTGNNNWTANYTMIAGDVSGLIPFAISCTDLAGNTSITVTASTNNSAVTFDKTAPAISNIVRQSPTAAVVNATTVTFRVNFSEPVKGITATAFVLTTSGATTAAIASVSSVSGTNVDVTVNGISGNGTLRLDLKNATSGITDAAGNATTGGFTTGETYTINLSVFTFPAGSSQSLTLCAGGATASLDSMLRVSGGDNGQALTWTIITNPSRGTLTGFPGTATINGAVTAASGLAYLPANGYTGTDIFTILVSDGIVTATASVNIAVNALPVVTTTATQGTILCGLSASLPITASGGNTYNWYNNGTLIQNITAAQLTVTTTGAYTARAIDVSGCIGAEGNAITITQLQKPTIAFVYASYCINKPVNFTDQSITINSGQVNYLWNDGNNHTSTVASPVFTFDQSLSYSVKLKITPVACPTLADSLSKLVNIESPVAAIRMPTVNAAVNDRINLQARTFGTGYQWLPSVGLSSLNSSATIATISKEQQYTVAISVPSGCVTVDTVLLRVFVANDILVPNIFSPNGDGQNDKLYVNLVGIKTLQYLRIYNRYGKKLFETNNLAEGWDGKFNGVLQPVDTYIWSASGIDPNGLPVRREGTVTLVR